MLKGLLVGAGVFLAGLVLGGFLLGQGGGTGAFASPDVQVQTNFMDSITVGPVGGATSNATIEEIHCTNASIAIPAMIPGATSTFTMALPGAETSTNQVYLVSARATSTFGVNFSATVTSTAGNIEVHAYNASALSLGAGTKNVSACYIQF